MKRYKMPVTALFVSALLLSGGSMSAATYVDANGWTVVTPSVDSRIVYVSSSAGDDSNDGLSPESPKKTLVGGDALIRDGYPDHLLLKRGDVFESEGLTTLGRWKSGRSAQEPLLLSYYGDEGDRPVVKVTNKFIDHNGKARDYQAFIGIEIYKSNSDPASPDFDPATFGSEGLRFVGGGDSLLLEDCRLRFTGIVIQSYGDVPYTNPQLLRNIVTDVWRANSYDLGKRTSGLFMSGVKEGYIIEENLFDHNGWSEEVENAGANMFNHNLYIQYNNVAGGIMRGNIIARGAAHGLQARSGGIIERNLFVLNAVSLNIGGVAAPKDPDVLTFTNQAVENVVLSGRLMDPKNSSWPRTTALWGIDATHYIPGAIVHDNIVANRVDDGTNRSYLGTSNGTFTENISYNWQDGVDGFDASWPHPDADAGDYFASLGGSSSTEDYLEWLRSRPLRSLHWNMTAYAAINYIREGFNKAPVSGYYKYEGESVPVEGVSVKPTWLTLLRDGSSSLSATVEPSDATDMSVVWSSADPSVATVDAHGVVSAVGVGVTEITVTTNDGGFTATTTVAALRQKGSASHQLDEQMERWAEQLRRYLERMEFAKGQGE